VINDPLAVALALEPRWGTAEMLRLTVNLAQGAGRGETTAGSPAHPPTKVYRDVALAPVHALLLEHLFGAWLTESDFRP